MFSQCYGSVIAGLNDHAFFKFQQIHLSIQRQKTGRAISAATATTPCVFRYGNQIGRFNFSVFHFGGHYIAGHHFGNAGWICGGINIFAREHLSGGRIHQQPGFCTLWNGSGRHWGSCWCRARCRCGGSGRLCNREADSSGTYRREKQV